MRDVYLPKRNVHMFSGCEDQKIGQFCKDVRSAWRNGTFNTDDRIDSILCNITPGVRSELKIQTNSNDPEVMHEVLKTLFGEQRSFVEVAKQFFTTKCGIREQIVDISYRIH